MSVHLVCVSHPSRVRGLKQKKEQHLLYGSKSHPSRVRGLKHDGMMHDTIREMSHPSWVRGLKHHRIGDIDCINHVAPLVGVWIETKCQQMHLIGLWEQWENPV